MSNTLTLKRDENGQLSLKDSPSTFGLGQARLENVFDITVLNPVF